MFSRIAGRYDLANHLLSGGVDFWWRRKLVRAVHDTGAQVVLDLATGSGDVAFEMADGLPAGSRIVGMDFCQPMLDEALKKQRARPRRSVVSFQQGDGMALPLADAQFDAVTISFGLRNMADRNKSLSEMRRVLRPGGTLFVLEFSQPARWFRPLYYAYLKHTLPSIAAVVTGDRSAYEYLCGSIEQFPGRAAMTEEIRRAGFTSVSAEALFPCGIVALHRARK
jgi:demethylmenaquinone methyltransferase / 2-methoxy-6-polyprenyl-1,4-benzoquinol methylase